MTEQQEAVQDLRNLVIAARCGGENAIATLRTSLQVMLSIMPEMALVYIGEFMLELAEEGLNAMAERN